MALLSVQQAKLTGQAITYAAASAGGDTFARTGDHLELRVKNADATSKTVTVVIPGNTEYGQPQPDVAVVVVNATEAAIGPIPAGAVDPADGLVHVTYSAVTSVTVALVGV
jgi:hypothetical protein